MEGVTWEALPQRKRKDRSNDSGGNEVVVASSAAASQSEVSSGSGAALSIQRHREIAENIRARSILQRANATLESLDGCPGEFYEYLDHTADIQLHCWGKTITDAFMHMAPCMFNYMTDLSRVVIDKEKTIEFTVKAHDMLSLLFTYMDELLAHFAADAFICVQAEILSFDRENFSISVRIFGDTYDEVIHTPGTEIKAITYSNMQIHENPDRTDLHVIVDI